MRNYQSTLQVSSCVKEFKEIPPIISVFYQVIFHSEASDSINEENLYMILAEAQQRNSINNLTGLLVYIEGVWNHQTTARFMQILEGDEDTVRAVFHKIKADRRHSNIVLIRKEVVSKRSFNDWRMKFERLDLNKHPELSPFFSIRMDWFKQNCPTTAEVIMRFLKAFTLDGD